MGLEYWVGTNSLTQSTGISRELRKSLEVGSALKMCAVHVYTYYIIHNALYHVKIETWMCLADQDY